MWIQKFIDSVLKLFSSFTFVDHLRNRWWRLWETKDTYVISSDQWTVSSCTNRAERLSRGVKYQNPRDALKAFAVEDKVCYKFCSLSGFTGRCMTKRPRHSTDFYTTYLVFRKSWLWTVALFRLHLFQFSHPLPYLEMSGFPQCSVSVSGSSQFPVLVV